VSYKVKLIDPLLNILATVINFILFYVHYINGILPLINISGEIWKFNNKDFTQMKKVYLIKLFYSIDIQRNTVHWHY